MSRSPKRLDQIGHALEGLGLGVEPALDAVATHFGDHMRLPDRLDAFGSDKLAQRTDNDAEGCSGRPPAPTPRLGG